MTAGAGVYDMEFKLVASVQYETYWIHYTKFVLWQESEFYKLYLSGSGTISENSGGKYSSTVCSFNNYVLF